jgi:hypothetical protein
MLAPRDRIGAGTQAAPLPIFGVLGLYPVDRGAGAPKRGSVPHDPPEDVEDLIVPVPRTASHNLVYQRIGDLHRRIRDCCPDQSEYLMPQLQVVQPAAIAEPLQLRRQQFNLLAMIEQSHRRPRRPALDRINERVMSSRHDGIANRLNTEHSVTEQGTFW